MTGSGTGPVADTWEAGVVDYRESDRIITVNLQAPVAQNQAPEITVNGEVRVDEGHNVSIAAKVTDPDGDALSL